MRALHLAIAVAAVAAITACSPSTSPDSTTDAPQDVTVEQAEAATPEQPPAQPEATPAAPAGTSAEQPPELFVMPNLVGQNLQLAQDTLQSLGSYVHDQQDASGLGRIQVLDSNWVVCSQNPVAGTQTALETMVQLASVKIGENCA